MLEQVISNKADWTRVAFGDVVRLSKLRAKDPEAEGYERVVGLEHIEPGDLRIRRWADIADGTTFTSVFKPGQVLFGKRRAYQRKVAVADFAGVCSGDIYVLEPSSDALMPELLPFICQTDAFFDHAVGTSAGSLSPRTNWKSLADFEFMLPPAQEQARLVKAMISGVRAKDTLYNSLSALQQVSSATIDERMRGACLAGRSYHEKVGEYFQHWPLCPLGDLLKEAQYGLSEEAGSSGQYPMLRMMNLVEGRVVENDIKYIDLSDKDFSKYRLNEGDVLFNRTNSYDLVGRTGVYDLHGDHVFASYLVRLITDDDHLDPDYLCAFLNAPIGRRQVMSFATRGVSQTNVNASNLKRILLPLPPLDYQRETVDLTRANHAAANAIAHRMQALNKLISQVISEATAS